MRLIAPPIIPDRDPRRDPIPGDKMQHGRSVMCVLPQERFPGYIAFRYPRTGIYRTCHMTLREWRRVMAHPDVIIVRYGETQATITKSARAEQVPHSQ